MGLLGHLSTAQIIEQVVEAKRLMQEEGDSTPVTNIVFMVRRGGWGKGKARGRYIVMRQGLATYKQLMQEEGCHEKVVRGG